MEFEFLEDEVTDKLAGAFNDVLGDDPDPLEPNFDHDPAKAAEYEARRLDAVEGCLTLLARQIDLLTAWVLFGPRFVGLTVEEAQANAAVDGLTIRVIVRDGEGLGGQAGQARGPRECGRGEGRDYGRQGRLLAA